MISEKKKLLHPRFGGSHQQRTHPVAGLQLWLMGREVQRSGQIKTVFADYQREPPLKTRRPRQGLKTHQSGLELIGRGTGLHLSLRADERQALHHTEGGIAGALRQRSAPGKHHLELQTLAAGHEVLEIALQEIPGKP